MIRNIVLRETNLLKLLRLILINLCLRNPTKTNMIINPNKIIRVLKLVGIKLLLILPLKKYNKW